MTTLSTTLPLKPLRQILHEANLPNKGGGEWGRTHPAHPSVLTDMLHVLRPWAASFPPSSSQQPTPPIPQGVHVLLARRADGLSSLDVLQRHPNVLGAPVRCGGK